jgi:sugar phosphate isomerase/epimerase
MDMGKLPEGSRDLTITIASARELVEYAARKNMFLLLENHVGITRDPFLVAEIFKAIDDPHFRANPDFGNFDPDIRYKGIEMVFHNPYVVHIKAYDFDDNGEIIGYDFARCMKIVKDHNYKGHYVIEYEGPGDELEGTLKTVKLLRKYL